MTADIFRTLLAISLPLAILLAVTALIRRATRIVRGWDAIAEDRR